MGRPPILSPRLAMAPMGAPVDQHAFEDDHRAGEQRHPGNPPTTTFPVPSPSPSMGLDLALDRIAIAALAC